MGRVGAALFLTVLGGPIGLILSLLGFNILWHVLSALETGVYERIDSMGAGELVRISRALDPKWFSSNVSFWGFVSFVLLALAAAILVPLGFYVKETFRPTRIQHREAPN